MSKQLNRQNIQKVVVILAGPRTGSSFLFRALSSLGYFLAPTGEETPFYRKAGLGIFTGTSYSDAIVDPPPEAVLQRAARLLFQDVGIKTGTCQNPKALVKEFFRRLELQWPECIPTDQRAPLEQQLSQKLYTVSAKNLDWRKSYLEWIAELQNKGLAVDPNLFSTSGHHPSKIPPLEEPPFITPEPKRAITRELAEKLPLLLKTSTNAFRIPLLRALFPAAKFSWIVLQRNPAAAISALQDGWLSSAFHSHDVYPHTRLQIRGYSEQIPGGNRFWKFDMPPGWQSFQDADLAEVCAFQWHSSYLTIGEFVRKCEEPIVTVQYENFFSTETNIQTIQDLVTFSGTKLKPRSEWDPSEPVASVKPPYAGKWKRRAPEIEALIKNHEGGALLEEAKRMGYNTEAMEFWP